MTSAELDRIILASILAKHEAARAAPEPPKWKRWEVDAWRLARDYGPRYSPKWFGDLAMTEAGRVRCLRAIRRLESEGLLQIHRGDAGKLERLTLTDAGLETLHALTPMTAEELAEHGMTLADLGRAE